MRPRRKLLVEDNVDSKEDNKSAKPDVRKSGGQRSTDNLSSESEAESKTGDDDETTLAVPKATKPATESTNDRQISITLTSSGTSRSSKTFMTDLKTIDPSMVRETALTIQNFAYIYIYIYMTVHTSDFVKLMDYRSIWHIT